MARVRLQDVADHAGVSMKTVSNVVRDQPYVSEAMRARVQRSIDALGYRPNLVGRQLATGRTGSIALGIPRLAQPYFARLASLVSDRARELGYRVLIVETNSQLDAERALAQRLDAGFADGVLFQPSRMTTEELAGRDDLPMVLLGESTPPASMDRVCIDNVAAAHDVTEHLIAAGRRRIAFVGHEVEELSDTSMLRIAGYERALAAHGIAVDPELLIATGGGAEGAVREVGAALAAGLEIDAIACRDDLAALGALRAAQRHGLRVPDDIMITGWDDIFMTEVSYPSLTTISPNLDELVGTALGFLTERIDGLDQPGRHVVVPYELVARESAPAGGGGGTGAGAGTGAGTGTA